MRPIILTIAAFAVALSAAGCSGGEPATMPDVVGKRLDVALSDVERAGFDDDVEVLGGGMFGVVDESNWTVCSQEPASGNEISSEPRVTVERTCDGGDAESADEGTVDDQVDQQAAVDVEPKKKKRKKKRPAADVQATFVMPALVGMNLQRAQDELQARGSFLLTQTDGTGLGRFQMLDANWKVCGQRPAAGAVTDLATLVELIAVKLDERC